MIKFGLLVEVPGELSDHVVGVAHKAEAVLQQLKKTGKNNTWTMVRVLGYSSPKSDYIDALAAGTARGGNLAMDNSFRLGPRRSTRSRRTLSRSVSMICPLG